MISKPWDWTKANETIWDEPTMEFYYIAERWSSLGLNRILDLGCGKGRHSVEFALRGFDVSACDLSPLAIEIVNQKAIDSGVKIKTTVCDILTLPYNDDTFDGLFGYHVVSHTDTEGLNRAISEIARVVRSGGEIYMDLVSKESKLFQTARNRIDSNTFIMEEIEAEKGLPHCCVDYEDIIKLYKDFELISVTLRFKHEIKDGLRYGGHYFIHARVI